MLLFKDVYVKAITLFDDPEINLAYVENFVRFEKLMYPFLQEGIGLFTNPTSVAWSLTDVTSPEGKMEIFSSEEVTDGVVVLSTVPKQDSDFVAMVNGVIDKGATMSQNEDGAYAITFTQPISEGDEVSVEWYFGGQFNTDFKQAATSLISPTVIATRVKEILALALAVQWARQEQNVLIDIKNNLTDTDFKIHSPANSIKEKTQWVDQLLFDLDTQQTKFAWDLYAVSRRSGGYYRG